MSTENSEENTHIREEQPQLITNKLQSPPKTYGFFAYVMSRIINRVSIFFVTFAIIITLTFYATQLMALWGSKTGPGSKFPFEALTPDFFTNDSYFIDKSIETTIKTGLKCSEEIETIAKQKDQSKDLFRRIEELNRQRFILISGEPGTGKTFTTKTILGSLPANYRIINIVPSSLQSQYIGESAKNLACIFKYITTNQNTKENLKFVVFFDECDTLLETSKEKMGREPLINQFLLIAGGDDKIKRLPFVCIFTTNTNVHQMMERGHRRFTHVTPALMNKESLKTVFNNYSKDNVMLKGITDLDDFYSVFTNQVLQFPLDFLKKVCESNGDVKSEFYRMLVEEKIKKENLFDKALEILQKRAKKFLKALDESKIHVDKLEQNENKRTRKAIKICAFWMERHKQELQSICVEYRRINRLAPNGKKNLLTETRNSLENIINNFRETAVKLKNLRSS